jgi:hypothetical protein
MVRLSSVRSKVSEGNGGVRLVTYWKVLMLSWVCFEEDEENNEIA